MRVAISVCFLLSVFGSSANQSLAALIDRSPTWPMCLLADLHRQRLRLEAIAAAGIAGVGVLVARELLAHPVALGLAEASLDVADHALERLGVGVAPHPVLVDEVDLLLGRPVEDGVLHLLRQLLPRRRHRHLEVPGQRLQRLLVVGRGAAGLGPGIDGALLEAQRRVGHHQVGLEAHLGAEPVALRAGAGRRVEREQPRLDLVDGEARHRTRKARREDDALVRLVLVAQDVLDAAPLSPFCHRGEGWGEGQTLASEPCCCPSPRALSPQAGRGHQRAACRRIPRSRCRRPAPAPSRSCPPAATRCPS